jgi:hypothetical protein
MNPNQINDIINSAMFSKNVSYTTPFSKGAYLAFVIQWKQEYALLSRAIRANKELEKEFKRDLVGAGKLTLEQANMLNAQTTYVLQTQIAFVQIASYPSAPGWMPMSQRLKLVAHFLLAIRKKMKIEAAASYQASHATSGQPETKALSQSTTADNRS